MITGFEIWIGARHILRGIQEVEKARELYKQALEQGKRAGLLEQRCPNLFSLRIANVLPGESIQAKYHSPGEDNESTRVDTP